MAITQKQAGAAVGGGSLGVIGAEGLQHAQRRDVISERSLRLIHGALGAGTVGLGTLTLAGVSPLPPEATAFGMGAGVGSSAWFVARESGVTPRITLDVPSEVNLADPLVTAAVLGVVGVGVATLMSGAS